MTRTLLAWAFLLAASLPAAALPRPQPAGPTPLLLPVQAEPAKLFRGTGTVTAVEPAGTVTLNHQPIEGLMPAMEMMFKLDAAAAAAAARLRPGDTVDFRIDGRTYVIAEIKVTGHRK